MTHMQDDSPALDGILTARPAAPAGTAPRGLNVLAMGDERDGLLYVPPDLDPGTPAPLVVMLHGAGSQAPRALKRFPPELAGAFGLVLMAPTSRVGTWDILTGGYGPDVAAIDEALGGLFAGQAIDPARVAIAGFSDGASYALSLGLANGALFTHILAFSPGFMAPPRLEGKPAVYVSHGTSDAVLPIDACSRRLVPMLLSANYRVHYEEFDGPHTVPPDLARAAAEWFVASPATTP